MHNDTLVSLIIPVFNEAENLVWHHEKITHYAAGLPLEYEIVYVNDGSSDNSLAIIQKLAAKDSHVHYISFSRNFGKEAATTAGLQNCHGDAAIMLDADGQHPIELVETFITEWQNGYATVIGVREDTKGVSIFKKLSSKIFYIFMRVLGSNQSTQNGLTDFRLVDRKIITEFTKLSEHNRTTRNLLDWLGYTRKLIPFTAHERHAGKATYTFRKLLKLAIDSLVKHSTRPLKFIGLLGALVSFFSFVLLILIIIEMYVLNDPMSLVVTGTALLGIITSLLIGIVLVCQGLLALYIENVYYETQNRPLFVIEEQG